MQIERLAFIAFPVSDLERSRDFYSKTIGCAVLAEGDDWADFDLGGTVVRAYIHSGSYQRQHSGHAIRRQSGCR